MSILEEHIEIPAEHESNIFGQFDAYAKKIERTLHVTLIARDGDVKILGEAIRVNQAKRVLDQLTALSKRGNAITEQNVDYAISLVFEDNEKELVEIDKDMIWASRYQITRGDAVSYRGYGFSFDYIYEGDSEIHSISYTDDYDGGYLHIDGEEYTRPGSHMDTWYGEDEYYNEQYMESIESSNKSRVYSAAKTVFKENYIDKVYSPVEQIYVSTKYQDEGSIGYSYDYNMDTYNVRFEVAVSDNFGVTWNNFVVQVQFYNNGNGYGVSMFNVY